MAHFVRWQAWPAVVIVTFVGWMIADAWSAPALPEKRSATSAEAVEAVLTALRHPIAKPEQLKNLDGVMDDFAAIFKALRPHLSESSQDVLDAFSDFAATAKIHDAAARKQFGKKLDDPARDYMPAAMLALRMTTASAVLMHTPEKTEVVRKTEKSATEIVVELRWRVGEGDGGVTMDESLVTVKETAGWKVLLPTRRVPFGFDLIGDQKKPEVIEVWDAEKVRASNKEMVRTLKAMTAGVKRLTGEVETGKYRNAKAYVPAMYSVATVASEGK